MTEGIYVAMLGVFAFLAAAKAAGVSARRWGLPPIFAELLVGLALGPYALGGALDSFFGVGVFELNPYLLFLSEFSVILMVFSAGLGHGFKSLRDAGVMGVASATSGAVLPFLGVYAYASSFTGTEAALLMGAACAATSLAAVSSVIPESGPDRERPHVKVLFSAASLDDVVAFALLSVALSLGAASTASKVAEQLAFIAISWSLIFLVSLFVVPRLTSLLPDSLVFEGSLVVLFGLVLAMTALGFSAVLAALVVGVSMAEIKNPAKLRDVTSMSAALLAVFGPLFFVTVGAQTDARSFLSPAVLTQGLAITALASALKFAGVFPFALLYTKDARASTAASLGMIPRGEMGLVISSLAFSMGAFTGAELSEIVMMALLTTLGGSYAFGWAHGKAVRAQGKGREAQARE